MSNRSDRPSGRTIAALVKAKNRKHPRDGASDGVIQMTTLAKLLSQKQELTERLQQEDIGPEERDEIGRLLDYKSVGREFESLRARHFSMT